MNPNSPRFGLLLLAGALLFNGASAARRQKTGAIPASGTLGRRIMACSISNLLIRNRHGVFGESHPKRRRAAIDEITEDCVFCDPMGGVCRGRDEIESRAGLLTLTFDTANNAFKHHRPEWLGPFNFFLFPLVSVLGGYPAGYDNSKFSVHNSPRI